MKRVLLYVVFGFILSSASPKSQLKQALFTPGVATKEKCNEVAAKVEEGIAAVVPGSRPISACREVKSDETDKKQWVVEISYLAEGLILLPSREDIHAYEERVSTRSLTHVIYKFDHENKTFEELAVVRDYEQTEYEYIELGDLESCEEWNSRTPLLRFNGADKYETYLDNAPFGSTTTTANVARFCDVDPDTQELRVVLLTSDIAMQTIEQGEKVEFQSVTKPLQAQAEKAEVTRFAEPYKTLAKCLEDKPKLVKFCQAQLLTEEIIVECAEYKLMPDEEKTGIAIVWNNAGITNENALEKWPTEITEHNVELISCLIPASSAFHGYVIENGVLVRDEQTYKHDFVTGLDRETNCDDPELVAFHKKMLDWSFDRAALFLQPIRDRQYCRATVIVPRGQKPRPLKSAADLLELYGMMQRCPAEP